MKEKLMISSILQFKFKQKFNQSFIFKLSYQIRKNYLVGQTLRKFNNHAENCTYNQFILDQKQNAFSTPLSCW